MQPHYQCVCGVDVHKEFLQVCILRRDEDPDIFRVFNNFSGIQDLKQRVEEEGCECIACESTGVYWYRLYLAFEGQTRVIVGNAYQIKSIPGVSVTTAVTALAEIGDYHDFGNAEKLASWAGLVPSVYQSAGKNCSGKITKHGSEHLRWILVQAAKSAGRTVNTTYRKFFNRIMYRKGANTATVALARKILCILWHLLMKNELYVDPLKSAKLTKPRPVQKFSKNSPSDIQKAIDFILDSGFKVIYPDATLDQNFRGVSR